jgi:translation elongation factor EF-Tu-like GTPase
MKVFYSDKLLFEKFIVFLVNKIDLVQDEEIVNEFVLQLKKEIKNIFKEQVDKVFLVSS